MHNAGDKSVAKRVLRAAASSLSTAALGRQIAEADTLEELKAALAKAAAYPKLQKLGQVVQTRVKTVEVLFPSFQKSTSQLGESCLQYALPHTLSFERICQYVVSLILLNNHKQEI